MRLCRVLPGLVGICLFAAPASAEWQTLQSEHQAAALYRSAPYALDIRCRRGEGFALRLRDLTASGNAFGGVDSLMMWVTLPDGRTDRWPVYVVRDGAGLSGALAVSEFNLDFFRNARSFELDSPQTREVFLAGDMAGTGAARLAFLERCGL